MGLGRCGTGVMVTPMDGGGNGGGRHPTACNVQVSLTGTQLIESIPRRRCQHRVRFGDDQGVSHGPHRSFEGVRLHQVVRVPEVGSGLVSKVPREVVGW